MKRICVYCGSNVGTDRRFGEAADQLGALIADRGLGLVYGGGNVGLMTRVADACMAGGGEVIGVIPKLLVEYEKAHQGLTKLVIVKDMHERKMMMMEEADGFIAMPGGLGTFEELFEVLTWNQLGIHQKPCGLLNAAHYYDQFLEFLNHAVSSGFVKPEHRQLLLVEDDPQRLLDAMAAWRPQFVGKWVKPDSET